MFAIILQDRTYIGNLAEMIGGAKGFCRVRDSYNAQLFTDELVANDVANRFGGRVLTLVPDDGKAVDLFPGDLIAKK